jgi:hypothetical protein
MACLRGGGERRLKDGNSIEALIFQLGVGVSISAQCLLLCNRHQDPNLVRASTCIIMHECGALHQALAP